MEKINRKEMIRLVYLYLFSLVGLVLIVIGSVQMINLGLTAWVFKQADQVIVFPQQPKSFMEDDQITLDPEELERVEKEQLAFEEKQRDSRRQRTASNALAMILVGAPLYLYHWRLIGKSKQ